MRIAIVGAGVGGLAAAYDLLKAGCEVTVFEASDAVGGLSAGFKIPRWEWSVEKYYHHWFASDRHMLGLIDELGWSHQVLFPRPTTAVYHEGAFFALDSPIAVLKFPGLDFINRLRLGMAVAYLKYLSGWKNLEDITAEAWMRKWMGEETYTLLWEPLLMSKFGTHYRDVNMAWMWARFKARTTRLGTFEGGFQAFMDAFATRVRDLGGEIRLRTGVEQISPGAEGGITVRFSGGQLEADHCLVTSSPGVMADLAPALPEDYLGRLLNLKSMGAVVMVLVMTHQLSEGGVYWHNLPKSAGFPFLSLVEHTNFIAPEFFGGDHIVYVGDYLEAGHEYFSLSKEQLLDRFLPAFERFNAKFEPSWIRDTWVFKTAYAQPVPLLNHSQSIPEVKTPISGLWFASMSQVYPWDRGTNFAVEIGRRTAAEILLEGNP